MAFLASQGSAKIQPSQPEALLRRSRLPRGLPRGASSVKLTDVVFKSSGDTVGIRHAESTANYILTLIRDPDVAKTAEIPFQIHWEHDLRHLRNIPIRLRRIRMFS